MINLRQGILTIIILCVCTTFAFKKCNTTTLKLSECSAYETCVESPSNNTDGKTVGYCKCKTGFEYNNKTECVPKQNSGSAQQPSTSSLVHDTNSSHLAAAILIPLFIISLVIIGVYIGYRYKLMTWVRTKMNQRQNNYDEVMIGQDLDDDDDPPLR